MTKTLVSLAAIGLALSATSSQAETMVVPFADLNLATPEGQARLAQRVDAAARSVCGVNEARVGTRIRDKQAAKCFEAAKAKAHAQFAAAAAQNEKGG
ncbi:UrcA family protein [Qipengyuania soli]|uniref:UrcA family protein n=1 Tax=Qipengyuania soli TaxID=2782568 RepID=A0A7S8F3Y8_9SPHN|nr:UrcA family protein [Qipengyuania soli]QPC98724.1 UrcA family protein [Qipengyuania soli]